MIIPADNERRVQELLAKQDIQELLYKWARSCDRIDEELMLSLFHPEGIVDYGFVRLPASEFAPWATKFHTEQLVGSMHAIISSLIRVDGDKAASESYVRGTQRVVKNGALYDLEITARYLDRFECRGGQWKFTEHVGIIDFLNPVKVDQTILDAADDVPHGSRDRNDLSYKYVGRLDLPA